MSSKPGMAAPSLDTRFTSATHRLDKVAEDCLRNGVRLHLQNLDQPGQGSGWGEVRPEPLSQNFPEMLDRVQICKFFLQSVFLLVWIWVQATLLSYLHRELFPSGFEMDKGDNFHGNLSNLWQVLQAGTGWVAVKIGLQVEEKPFMNTSQGKVFLWLEWKGPVLGLL